MIQFWIGIILELLAGAFGTAGKQLVSLSARRASEAAGRPLKYAGLMITTLIGPILDSAAYAFAPQSVVAPLAGMDVVWNCLSAPLTLGEKLMRRHVIGALFVAVGACLTAVFGPHLENDIPLADLKIRFVSWRVALYLALFACGLFVSLQILHRRPRGSGGKLRAFALGGTAGAIAGNMYFVSAALGLFKNSIASGDWSAWTDPFPYALVIGALVVALSNIPFMASGLQEFEAVFMVPLFEGCHIVGACISGQVVLQEMDDAEYWQWIGYWSAVLIIVTGLWAIQSGSVRNITREVTASAPSADPEAMQDIEEFALGLPSDEEAANMSSIFRKGPVQATLKLEGLAPVGPALRGGPGLQAKSRAQAKQAHLANFACGCRWPRLLISAN